MLHRNLLAMDAEELLRGHPVDGAVLMGGCDKATPALLLALVLSTCDSGQTLSGFASQSVGSPDKGRGCTLHFARFRQPDRPQRKGIDDRHFAQSMEAP
jgi:hypothetical protein